MVEQTDKEDEADAALPKRKSLLPKKGVAKKQVKNLKELSAEEVHRLEQENNQVGKNLEAARQMSGITNFVSLKSLKENRRSIVSEGTPPESLAVSKKEELSESLFSQISKLSSIDQQSKD